MWCFATDVPLLPQSIPKRHLLVLVHPLLIGIFDKETLLKSSLRGGKSRTSQDVNQSEMSIEQGEGVHYTRSVHIKDSLFE